MNNVLIDLLTYLGLSSMLVLFLYLFSLGYVLLEWFIDVGIFLIKKGKIRNESLGHIILGIFLVIDTIVLLQWFFVPLDITYGSVEYYTHIKAHLVTENMTLAFVTRTIFQMLFGFHLNTTRNTACGTK